MNFTCIMCTIQISQFMELEVIPLIWFQWMFGVSVNTMHRLRSRLQLMCNRSSDAECRCSDGVQQLDCTDRDESRGHIQVVVSP